MFIEIDPPGTLAEIIEWHAPSDEMPDADTTVLLIIAGDIEVRVGYFNGKVWCEAIGALDGFPIMDDVLFWSHLPEGPMQ